MSRLGAALCGHVLDHTQDIAYAGPRVRGTASVLQAENPGKMKCPCCGKNVRREHFACQSGAKGGKAGKGKAKARSSEQARDAVRKRWERARQEDA